MIVGIYEQSKNQNIDVVTTVDRNAISATLFGYSVYSTFRNATGREKEHVCVVSFHQSSDTIPILEQYNIYYVYDSI